MFEELPALPSGEALTARLCAALGALPAASVVRPLVQRLVDQPPGPGLLLALDALARCDLTRRERVATAGAWERLKGLTEAGKLLTVADLQRATAESSLDAPVKASRRDPTRAVADLLAPVLHISGPAASALVGRAVRVDASLPAAADALADGRMGIGQLEVLDAVARDLRPAARARVEASAVRLAPTTTRAQLAQRLAEEAVAADPEHAARAMAEGVAERDVQLRRSPRAGCRRVVADLPSHDAIALWQVVNGVAVAAKDGHPGGAGAGGADGAGGAGAEVRGLAQLRADALVTLVTGWRHERLMIPDGVLTAADDPGPVRVPSPAERTALAEVHIVVSADDLPADDDPGDSDDGPGDSPGGGPAGTGPFGHVPGHGPLDPVTTAEALRRAPWRRLLADPVTGQLLERSSRRHRPPPGTGHPLRDRLGTLLLEPRGGPPDLEDHHRPSRALAAHVRARDATCLGTACSRPARTAGVQLDHVETYRADGHRGQTRATGLSPLCRRDHQAKTHGGWTLARPTSAAVVWTSPLGDVHTASVRPLVPGWRPR